MAKTKKIGRLKFLFTSENRHIFKRDFVNMSCVNMRLEGEHHSQTLNSSLIWAVIVFGSSGCLELEPVFWLFCAFDNK